MIEIYLAVIWTYLSISFTLFLIVLFLEKSEWEKIKQWNIKRQVENDLWKDEVLKIISKK